ncbi:hypothetical protein BDL97_13G104100 [Sphagnum fallax]|nr:hypothetical protein BDL97_13G104100 [Sphagnum fallax]
MEDPRTDIEYVVRGLVEKPTLRRQAAVLHKYFTPDVQFYHFYINTNGVDTRPWLSLGATVSLKFNTLLQLEDWRVEGGKTVKKIKVQKDYFLRAPTLQFIPIFGRIYDSDTIRFILGWMMATFFMLARTLFLIFCPATLWHGLIGLWSREIEAEEEDARTVLAEGLKR